MFTHSINTLRTAQSQLMVDYHAIIKRTEIDIDETKQNSKELSALQEKMEPEQWNALEKIICEVSHIEAAIEKLQKGERAY